MTDTTPQPEQFSADELQVLVQLIDACAQRGAFKGEELAVVGAIRTKVVSLIPAPVA